MGRQVVLPGGTTNTLLLTWNPDTSSGERVRLEHEMCLEAQSVRDDHYRPAGIERVGPSVVSGWNTHARKGVGPGDKVFLLMQGNHDRGIIRDGIIVSDPVPGQHLEF